MDANQSWTRDLLEQVLPALAALGVEMVAQPVRRAEDAQLRGLRSPLPLAADESCTDRGSLAALTEYYQCINIKLDKCGGLGRTRRGTRRSMAPHKVSGEQPVAEG